MHVLDESQGKGVQIKLKPVSAHIAKDANFEPRKPRSLDDEVGVDPVPLHNGGCGSESLFAVTGLAADWLACAVSGELCIDQSGVVHPGELVGRQMGATFD